MTTPIAEPEVEETPLMAAHQKLEQARAALRDVELQLADAEKRRAEIDAQRGELIYQARVKDADDLIAESDELARTIGHLRAVRPHTERAIETAKRAVALAQFDEEKDNTLQLIEEDAESTANFAEVFFAFAAAYNHYRAVRQRRMTAVQGLAHSADMTVNEIADMGGWPLFSIPKQLEDAIHESRNVHHTMPTATAALAGIPARVGHLKAFVSRMKLPAARRPQTDPWGMTR